VPVQRTGFRADRLGLGDWLIGVASLALIVDVFALPWFGYAHGIESASFGSQHVSVRLIGSTHINGWEAFGILGPLTVFVCLLGIAIWCLQAVRPSPALPVVSTIAAAPLAAWLLIGLAISVLLDPPGVVGLPAFLVAKVPLHTYAGAYIGVFLSLVIAVGIYVSLRRDGVAVGDSPAGIETLDVAGTPAAGRA
jgi:hypothetical protein